MSIHALMAVVRDEGAMEGKHRGGERRGGVRNQALVRTQSIPSLHMRDQALCVDVLGRRGGANGTKRREKVLRGGGGRGGEGDAQRWIYNVGV